MGGAAIKSSLEHIMSGGYHGVGIGIHGGEPTLAGTAVIEEIFKIMQPHLPNANSRFSVTTNAYLIDNAFIKLFSKYPTHIGVSMDGPASLNILRGPNPSDEKVTRKYAI